MGGEVEGVGEHGGIGLRRVGSGGRGEWWEGGWEEEVVVVDENGGK